MVWKQRFSKAILIKRDSCSAISRSLSTMSFLFNVIAWTRLPNSYINTCPFIPHSSVWQCKESQITRHCPFMLKYSLESGYVSPVLWLPEKLPLPEYFIQSIPCLQTRPIPQHSKPLALSFYCPLLAGAGWCWGALVEGARIPMSECAGAFLLPPAASSRLGPVVTGAGPECVTMWGKWKNFPDQVQPFSASVFIQPMIGASASFLNI